jgi:hypothetical protein
MSGMLGAVTASTSPSNGPLDPFLLQIYAQKHSPAIINGFLFKEKLLPFYSALACS